VKHFGAAPLGAEKVFFWDKMSSTELVLVHFGAKSSSGGKGKGKAIELVGPRSGSFLPPDMPPREELDGHVPWIIQCDCGVECCYTANEAKIRNGGRGGSWGFVCGHTLSPAPYFVSFLSVCLFKLFLS
jgi:hypothetical protein